MLEPTVQIPLNDKEQRPRQQQSFAVTLMARDCRILRERILDWDGFFATLRTLYPRRQVEGWRDQRHAVHLALMQGEFLELIISGDKSIESRFTKNRVAPVGNVEAGDLVLFKQVGRELFAVAVVEKAKTGVLDDATWAFVRRHADDIGIDEDYIEYKSDSRYYVLVWVKNIHVILPIPLKKRDRRAWVVLRDRLH